MYYDKYYLRKLNRSTMDKDNENICRCVTKGKDPSLARAKAGDFKPKMGFWPKLTRK